MFAPSKVLFLLCGLLLAQSLPAAQRVLVGATEYRPYMAMPAQGQPSGLLPELLQAMNEVQDDYRFEITLTSTGRRYRDFTSGRLDLMLFESRQWGWQNIPMQTLELGIDDSEVFVARAAPGRDQRYFATLEGKRLGLHVGYHYAFADFESDSERLHQRFDAIISRSHEANLEMLLHQRIDLTVMAKSYLRMYFDEHPELRERMLVSTRADQTFRPLALIRPDGPIDAERLAAILEILQRNGRYAALLTRYHLDPVPASGKPKR
ncbi:transporter substrate-binding domain-containing protein [Pseudomonas sp.]|uniref:substrate-binding periplasmic protein n=1 Tax=Pseudomonas sp. TaxID=306 RepID=UPI0028A843CC|nr:transporter substrate-binding domain-containing protein [Pseudomonas sp.]